MGSGTEGLESDPPLYHFDLKTAEIDDLVKNPGKFLRDLGLTDKSGLLLDQMSVTVAKPELGWDEDEQAWTAKAKPTGKFCCHTAMGHVFCFRH